MKDLKPCPFCGHIPTLFTVENKFFTVKCTNNNCVVNPSVKAFINEKDAIYFWNRRKRRKRIYEKEV